MTLLQFSFLADRMVFYADGNDIKSVQVGELSFSVPMQAWMLTIEAGWRQDTKPLEERFFPADELPATTPDFAKAYAPPSDYDPFAED